MVAKDDPIRDAAAMHEKICARLDRLRATKVDVYFLLREFHERSLFRHLHLPMAPAHADRLARSSPGICAGRSAGGAEICAGHSSEGAGEICTGDSSDDAGEICAGHSSDDAEICAGRSSDGAEICAGRSADADPEICTGHSSEQSSILGGGEAPALDDGADAEICAGRRSEQSSILTGAPRPPAARRRFTTWEDYLAYLGDGGISFSYFAELERLHRRFGEGFVRLCAVGVPVRTRRLLLSAPRRITDEVYEAVNGDLPDAAKREAVDVLAKLWKAELDARRRGPAWLRQRVVEYRHHAAEWERKLAAIVDEMRGRAFVYPRTQLAGDLVGAWREVFEAHLAIGERLARMRLGRDLTGAHAAFLGTVRAAWGGNRPGGGRLTDADALPGMPPPSAGPGERPRPGAVFLPPDRAEKERKRRRVVQCPVPITVGRRLVPYPGRVF